MKDLLSNNKTQANKSTEDSEAERLSDKAESNRLFAMLKESEMRYRRFFESAQDGILILNFDNGNIVDANPFII